MSIGLGLSTVRLNKRILAIRGIGKCWSRYLKKCEHSCQAAQANNSRKPILNSHLLYISMRESKLSGFLDGIVVIFPRSKYLKCISGNRNARVATSARR